MFGNVTALVGLHVTEKCRDEKHAAHIGQACGLGPSHLESFYPRRARPGPGRHTTGLGIQPRLNVTRGYTHVRCKVLVVILHGIAWSGDTTPSKVTPVIQHGVAWSGDTTPSLRSSYTGL